MNGHARAPSAQATSDMVICGIQYQKTVCQPQGDPRPRGIREPRAQELQPLFLNGLPVIWTLWLPERLEMQTPTLAPFHLDRTYRQIYHVNRFPVWKPQYSAAATAVPAILFS